MAIVSPVTVGYVLDAIAGFKEAHASVLIPVVFFGFFLFGAVAVFRKDGTRQIYVVGVLCLLLVSSQLALTMAPFIHAHRYSGFADQSYEKQAVTVVDSSGNELMLDERAVLPFRHVRGDVARGLAYEWSEEERLRAAERILDDAESHRERVSTPVPWLRHPPPSATFYWDRETVRGYGGFESLRIYEIRTVYEDDSYRVAERNKTCIAEIEPDKSAGLEDC